MLHSKSLESFCKLKITVQLSIHVFENMLWVKSSVYIIGSKHMSAIPILWKLWMRHFSVYYQWKRSFLSVPRTLKIKGFQGRVLTPPKLRKYTELCRILVIAKNIGGGVRSLFSREFGGEKPWNGGFGGCCFCEALPFLFGHISD